ncbi:UDP-N-acetylmuramate dehydrogenase [Alphaproteobacteria bacterium endosymbiont of Tiliacea citrago]|uniref:UDP-N-acetylmuramate dehydrogenase n=1 Tax=Alphaproteobacteria bacterium endosymbiont of Tiliacea citrago TaxID=3077944 RepID=UPI00313E811B
MQSFSFNNFVSKLKKIDLSLEAKKWTNLALGGKPLLTFFPESIEEIQFFIKNKPENLKYRTFGAGSNILIRDNGYNGVFIRLNKTLKQIKLNQNLLIADAGAGFAQITQFCLQNELGGLEFISTIPGQMGGLAKMNAGIPEIEMKDIVEWVEFIDEYGNLNRLNNSDCGFQYRKSCFKNNWIITKVALKTFMQKKDLIFEKINQLKNKRKLSQPTIGKIAGCFFKNPLPNKAWKIIENTNLKSCGDTFISNLHKNFIIADKSLDSYEVEYLINSIKAKSLFQQNCFLESEVEIIGNY